MKKRLYDFSVATAIIVILGYAVVFMVSIFSIVHNGNTNYGSFIFLSILIASFLYIIVDYGLLSIKISDDSVSHKQKKISKSNLVVDVRRNYRLKYDELVLRDKTIDYEKLSKKEISKHEIVVQYFPNYETFLNEYLEK